MIAAAAAPRRGSEVAVADTIDLTKQCGPRKLAWDAPAGEWDVFVVAERVLEGASFAHFYVDVFNPEVTRHFIELTDEAYKRALGPELFKHIRGWFSDEPFFLDRYSGTPSETPLAFAPWSPILRDALRTPLAQTLVAIFGDADRAGRRIRREFHETKMRLYLDNFWKPRAEWAARHGQVQTGHEGGQIGGGGDFARSMGVMQMPGMDWLGLARAEYRLRMVEAKVVTSVARHSGKPAMQEGPGVFKWNQTLSDVRVNCDTFALYDFQSFTFSGYHYTVEGKRYYSPSAMFYQSSHWPLAGQLVRHCTRLVWALAQGTIPMRAAVLWSPETVWSDVAELSGMVPRGKKRAPRIEEDWMPGVEMAMGALMAGHVEFGVLDTAALLDKATLARFAHPWCHSASPANGTAVMSSRLSRHFVAAMKSGFTTPAPTSPTATPPDTKSSECRTPSAARNTPHQLDWPTWPLNRFVSADAGTDPGVLTTVPLHFTGNRLELNLDASRGSVRVELLDAAGKPIAGYGESDPVNADSLRATVSWKEKSNLSALAGKPVNVRFHFQQAELYSFAFRE